MGTLFVGAVLVAVIAAAVYKLRKDKKEGKGCSGNCGSCSSCGGHCHHYSIQSLHTPSQHRQAGRKSRLFFV